MSKSWTKRSWVLAAVVFVCAAALPFVTAVTHGYSQFDDIGMLEGTDAYQGLSLRNLAWMFSTVHMGHYQPLAWLSFAIEWTVFGSDPGVSHAINVLIHGVNGVLVFVLASMLIAAARPGLSAGMREWGALLAAVLLGGAHPLRVESVAWVTERRDVLSLVFFLLALIWYVKTNQVGLTREARRARMTWVWVFFVLSLLSKAWGMTFFVVLLILDWYPLARICGANWRGASGRAVIVEKIPFALVGVAWAVVAGMAQAAFPGTALTLERWGAVDRVCQGVHGLVFYPWKTVWPTGLSVLYELPRGMRVVEARVLVAMGVTAVAAVVCVVMRRKWPALAAAALAYVVIVSPVLGLFQSGIQLVADRYSYIAMIPPMIALGGGFAVWLSSRGRSARVGAGAAMALGVTGLVVLASRQTSLWRDDRVLFGHAIASGQDGPILRVYYGKQLERAGRVEDALAQYQRSAELDPRYGEAWYAVGNAQKGLKRFDEAKRAYAKAIELMPDSWKADQAMGLLLAADLDDLEGALPHFRRAVEKIDGPQAWAFAPGPYMTLAQALFDLGDVAGAKRELEKAVRHKGTHQAAAAALRQMGDRR